jgi:hypothetical protein
MTVLQKKKRKLSLKKVRKRIDLRNQYIYIIFAQEIKNQNSIQFFPDYW